MRTKKNRIVASCFLALCLQAACGFSYEPKRVAGVPQEAVWAGGADGGSWILCETRNPEGTRYFCRVFNDVSGKEMASGEYILRKSEWNREQQKAIYTEVGESRQGLKYKGFDGSKIYLAEPLILLPGESVVRGR